MTIPDHLITPLDWSAEALRHAAAWTGQPEGARALVESKRYLAMHEEAERLRAEVARLSPTEDEIRYTADQDWTGLDGMTAYWLIDRHGDGWAGIGAMMEAWRDAEVRRITAGLTAEADALRRERDMLRLCMNDTACRALVSERDELRTQVHIITSERDELADCVQSLRAKHAELAARLEAIEQAELIDVPSLVNALTLLGISSPESQESAGACVGELVSELIRGVLRLKRNHSAAAPERAEHTAASALCFAELSEQLERDDQAESPAEPDEPERETP